MTTKEKAQEHENLAIDIVCDAVGRLVEFIGLKAVFGRIWTLLFLTEKPLSAAEISKRLNISIGLCSMSLNELLKLGVIERSIPKRGRTAYYVANTDLWKAGQRLMQQREEKELSDAVNAMKRAILLLENQTDTQQLQEKIADLAGFVLVLRLALQTLLDSGVLNLAPVRNKLGIGEYATKLKNDAELQRLWEEEE